MRLSKKLIAALGAVTLFCSLAQDSDARFFGRRKATNNCPGGVCRRPATSGPGLSINSKGGFEGQLPDSYYQGQLPKAPMPTPTPNIAKKSEASLAAAKVVKESAQGVTVDQATKALETAKRQLREAELLVAKANSQAELLADIAQAEAEAKRLLAEVESNKTKAIQTAELSAEIRQLTIAQSAESRRIEELKKRQQSLTAPVASVVSPDMPSD